MKEVSTNNSIRFPNKKCKHRLVRVQVGWFKATCIQAIICLELIDYWFHFPSFSFIAEHNLFQENNMY